ncbi:VirK/YbjX family protein [Paraburkholderia sp. J94]|uniref:VirK/YbjX family protein n=1 Tax=Paraburkholderia sp. J94 TaxID=2805441 RepID=UPI002AB28C67|nr:DUF535 family protein [Paraburkholderia sp. J94]
MTSIAGIFHLLSRAIPGRNPSAIVRRLRIVMYAVLHPVAARIWLSTLASNALLGEIAIRNRRYLERPFRQFIQAGMRAGERAALLRGHFRVVQECFGDEWVRSLYLDAQDQTLAVCGRYAVVLREPVRCWREGLLTVAWRDVVAQVDLAWATVSFEWHAESGKRGALIGGLQGPASEGREQVREATRACHGLRPKAAVLEVVCALCRIAGVDELAGVTKKTHVSYATQSQMSADYDGFWQEIGGVEANGRYVLPLHLHHRDISEVPSHRRAAFRRRQALIADLLAQIASAMETDQAEKATPTPLNHPKPDNPIVDLATLRAIDHFGAEPRIVVEIGEPMQSDPRRQQKIAA